jgi:hypothetical protein
LLGGFSLLTEMQKGDTLNKGNVLPLFNVLGGNKMSENCKQDFFETINKVIGLDWENGNKRIKEVGVEKYFNEKKNISHYISYKK